MSSTSRVTTSSPLVLNISPTVRLLCAGRVHAAGAQNLWTGQVDHCPFPRYDDLVLVGSGAGRSVVLARRYDRDDVAAQWAQDRDRASHLAIPGPEAGRADGENECPPPGRRWKKRWAGGDGVRHRRPTSGAAPKLVLLVSMASASPIWSKRQARDKPGTRMLVLWKYIL
jgi:hypothetical protein